VSPRSLIPLALAGCLLLTSCSVKKYAIRQVGASLNSGSSVFESDRDIELVGGALPFSLKFVESLLAEVPNDRNLLVTACRGFTLYSYAYVDFEADKLIEEDLNAGREMRARARRLYLRGVNYGLRGLETVYPGFGEHLKRNPTEAVAVTNPKKADRDLPLLYWTAASLGLAISTATDDAAMLARLPEVEALLNRAIELNPAWDEGALYDFRVVFESSRPGSQNRPLIEESYRKALELSGGKSAGVYVSYAEAVAIPDQNVALFRDLMNNALAVDLEQDPDNRLRNALAQRRAQWMLDRIEDLFLVVEPSPATN
jgi:predicted anti-sigma-YlaC factor YlaD